MNRLFVLLVFFTSFSLQSFTDTYCEIDSQSPKGLVLMDYENKFCFVDLMVLNITVEHISVYNDSQEALEEVDCMVLNTQDIIEFDMSSYPTGTYVLHFKTISGGFDYSIEL